MKTLKLALSKKAFFGLLATLMISGLALNPAMAQSTNTVLGTGAGNAGDDNTSIGYNAGDVTGGIGNTYIGYLSGSKSTTANYNTFLGSNSGRDNTTGGGNVYIGRWSGALNVAGASNTFLGYFAGYNTSGSGNVFIGRSAGYNESGSNKLYIDNSSTAIPLIYGDFSSNEVGINTNQTSGYTLSVNGKIRATEVRVYTGWADYVFEADYDLQPLEEVDAYIKENKHLPNVPTAAEVESEGILLGEMNATLLRKIEELTLYVIEQDKKIAAQEKEMQEQQQVNEKLADAVTTLSHKLNELIGE